jgi:hypothetical protein
VSSPHPPIPIDVRPPLTGRVVIWIVAISLVVAAMVWLALFQVKTIAEDNVPTAAETAQCVAERDPDSKTSLEEDCPTEPTVIWAARHPLRHASAVFVLLVATGIGAIYLNRRLR